MMRAGEDVERAGCGELAANAGDVLAGHGPQGVTVIAGRELSARRLGLNPVLEANAGHGLALKVTSSQEAVGIHIAQYALVVHRLLDAI